MSKTPPRVVRVLLLDERPDLGAGLRALIESREGFAVVGQARDRGEALAMLTRTRPDLIVLDLDRSGKLELLAELRAPSEGSRIVVLTGLQDPGLPYRALQMGVMGIVPKDELVESLGDALEAVHAGRAWVDGGVMARVLAHASPAAREQPIPLLTRRERQIVELVTRGLRNQTVADRLFLSEGTVRNHLTAIFRKLGLADRCELIAYAHDQRLAGPQPRDAGRSALPKW